MKNRKLFLIIATILILILSFSTIVFGKESQDEQKSQDNQNEIVEETNIDDNSILNSVIVIETEDSYDVVSVTPTFIAKINPEKSIYDIKSEEVLKKQEELKSIANKKEWFIAYKNLINEYSEWVDPPESIYDIFTDDEIYLMQRCIETETYEQNFESKVNVASVILNRINSEEFSNNVHNVIIPGQFAFGRDKINEDTKLALEYAFMIGDSTNGALYFHSNSKTSTFNGASYMFTDDAGHHFYK